MWAQGEGWRGSGFTRLMGLPLGPPDLSLLPTGAGTGWTGGRGGGARRGRGGGRRGAPLSREEVLASQRWGSSPPGAGHYVRGIRGQPAYGSEGKKPGGAGGWGLRVEGGGWLSGGRSWITPLLCQPPLPPFPCVHSAPGSRGGPRAISSHNGPAAGRVRNLNHLWGRLRDFYQVRGREGEAELGSPLGEGPPLISPAPSTPRRNCSC